MGVSVTEKLAFEAGNDVPGHTGALEMAHTCDQPGREWLEMRAGPGPFGSHHEKEAFRVKVIKGPKEFRLSGKALLHRCTFLNSMQELSC